MIPLLWALVAPAAAQDTVPAGPDAHVLTLLVTNAVDVARKEKGAAVVTIADVFLDINKKAQKAIAAEMVTKLAAHGVDATVVPKKVSFPGPGLTRFYYWDTPSSDFVPVALPPGNYVVLRVDIRNPDDVLAGQTGAGIAWALSKVGVDTDLLVTQKAAPVLLQELQTEGITAVMGM